MNQSTRLARLEQQPLAEGRLTERAEAYARAHDLSAEDVLGEAARFLTMPPADQARAAADLLPAAPPASECAAHGGPPCGARLRQIAERER